ncbi:uncharacterized protein G2W53_028739 [Senna tora]|uniref:Uncharacterized protein n=1 Tax=Senna tora TaxID=362788 RepID=A0A834T4N5_9FABA|nr:uncharacterized protein G2W53_028739 [Senna tora]
MKRLFRQLPANSNDTRDGANPWRNCRLRVQQPQTTPKQQVENQPEIHEHFKTDEPNGRIASLSFNNS